MKDIWERSNMRRSHKISVLVFTCFLILCSVSCSSNLFFDKTMDTCLEITGAELYTVGESEGEKPENCCIYVPDEKEYSQKSKTHLKRHMSVNDFIRLEEFDFKWNVKKEFKPQPDFMFADSLMLQTTDRIQELNIEEGYILEYGTVLFDDNYEGYLYARYLVGKNVLSFVIFFSDGDDERNEYDIYQRICDESGLFTSEKIDEYVDYLCRR